MNVTIYPTHTCFSDVIDYLNAKFLRDGEKSLEYLKTVYIVHGIMLGQENLRPFAHAWLETPDDTVLHSGIKDGQVVWGEFPKAKYYKTMRVKEATRYTLMEAIYQERKFGRPGPWVRKYYRLCSDGKKKNQRQ